MVNRVVPRDQLEAKTMALAERIASRPSMRLKLAKMSVNQSVDARGFPIALQSVDPRHGRRPHRRSGYSGRRKGLILR